MVPKSSVPRRWPIGKSSSRAQKGTAATARRVRDETMIHSIKCTKRWYRSAPESPFCLLHCITLTTVHMRILLKAKGQKPATGWISGCSEFTFFFFFADRRARWTTTCCADSSHTAWHQEVDGVNAQLSSTSKYFSRCQEHMRHDSARWGRLNCLFVGPIGVNVPVRLYALHLFRFHSHWHQERFAIAPPPPPQLYILLRCSSRRKKKSHTIRYRLFGLLFFF